MNRTLDLVFGGGRYACLGKAIALIELGTTFAEVSHQLSKVDGILLPNVLS